MLGIRAVERAVEVRDERQHEGKPGRIIDDVPTVGFPMGVQSMRTEARDRERPADEVTDVAWTSVWAEAPAAGGVPRLRIAASRTLGDDPILRKTARSGLGL